MRLFSGSSVGLAIVGLVAGIAVTHPAAATAGVFDAMSIGNVPAFGGGYTGIWRTASLGNGQGYSVITEGTNLFLNAPSSSGNILFRSGNGGGIPDPAGGSSFAYIDHFGDFATAGYITAQTTQCCSAITAQYSGSSNGGAGIVGYYHTGSGGAGVAGFDDVGNGAGVVGTSTAGSGVQGTATSGYGVRGNSSNSDGVYGTSGGTFGVGVYGTTSAIGGAGGSFTNTSGNSSGVALQATGASGYGLYATTNETAIPPVAAVHGGSLSFGGNGVEGVAIAGIGVLGMVSTSTGIPVYAQAASSSATAFYGVGNITLTGSSASKNGGSPMWLNTSDIRTKKNIEAYNAGLAEIERINPISYEYNGLAGTEADGKRWVGVSAQDLEKIAPYMVSSVSRKLHPTDTGATDIKQVDSAAFTFMLINSVKELSAQVRDLRAELAAVKGQSRLFASTAGHRNSR